MPPTSRHSSWSLIQVCVMHTRLCSAASRGDGVVNDSCVTVYLDGVKTQFIGGDVTLDRNSGVLADLQGIHRCGRKIRSCGYPVVHERDQSFNAAFLGRSPNIPSTCQISRCSGEMPSEQPARFGVILCVGRLNPSREKQDDDGR